MKKILTIVLCLTLVGSAIFAAGAAETAPAAAKDSNVVKVALIIENTIDDKGWCQAMHDGILAAQKQLPGRIEYSYTEKMKPVDAGSAARQYVAQGYDIIIAHGDRTRTSSLKWLKSIQMFPLPSVLLQRLDRRTSSPICPKVKKPVTSPASSPA